MTRIKKIKITPETKIFIHYQKEAENGWDDYTMTSSEPARDGFYDTLNELRQSVIEMCELPEDDLNKIQVRGVSFSHAHDIMGATITAQKVLLKSNVPLNINTPHKITEFYSGAGDEKQLLSDLTIDILNSLQNEAEEYIKGNRAQMGLFAAEG